MELNVREAATLMGRSPRTVRAQLARGDLPGVKRQGQWRLQRRHLPLTEDQRRALQARAEGIRQLVEEALPGRTATTSGDRRRSLADLDAFRKVLDLRQKIAADTLLEPPIRDRFLKRLLAALLALGEAFHQFDRRIKLEAVNRCRAQLARLAAELLSERGSPPPEPLHDWLLELEREILPSIAGLARWIDKLGAPR